MHSFAHNSFACCVLANSRFARWTGHQGPPKDLHAACAADGAAGHLPRGGPELSGRQQRPPWSVHAVAEYEDRGNIPVEVGPRGAVQDRHGEVPARLVVKDRIERQ